MLHDSTKLQGVWMIFHIQAKEAQTDKTKRAFQHLIENFLKYFKCSHCVGHAQEFYKSHPLSDYWDMKDVNGVDIGMFYWTWLFHNSVNRRLKKYTPSFEEAYQYWNSDTPVCTSCAVPDHQPPSHHQVPDILQAYLDSKRNN